MKFEWDEDKAKRNLEMGRPSFWEAQFAFQDPYRLIIPDNRKEYGEVRLSLYGKSAGRVFVVTFTIRGDVFRIIHARKANKREVQKYERDKDNYIDD